MLRFTHSPTPSIAHSDRPFARALTALAAAALSSLVLLSGSASAEAACSDTGMVAHEQPSSCWRPYADDSPFNTRIPRSPSVSGKSKSVASNLASDQPLNYFVAGDSARDYGIPVYYATPSDPKYQAHCKEPWGTCDIEGDQIPVPQGAAPSGVWPLQHPNDFHDSHITIVDTASGWEYDLWNVRSLGAGQVVASWGGKTKIDGDGLGSDAVASQFGSLAGTIRPEELSAGKIRHALVLNVPCTNGYVWPATKGAMECSEAGLPSAGAPAVGQLLQLKLSNRKIDRMGFPRWKEGVLKAFHRYGAYVSDTIGAAGQWNLRVASGAQYTSMGEQDKFVSLARSLDMGPEDYNGNGENEYWFDMGGDVDWQHALRVIESAR